MGELGRWRTLNYTVVAPFDSHVGHTDQFKLRELVLSKKVLGQVLVLLSIPHCAANIVSSLQ